MKKSKFMSHHKKKSRVPKEKGYYIKRIPSYIMYVVSGILILLMIPSIYKITADATRQIDRSRGYGAEALYESFINGEYETLFAQIAFNQGIEKEMTEQESDYYAFAACYNSAVDYRMYMNTEQTDKAKAEYDNFIANEAKIRHSVFKEALADTRKTYGLE